MSGYIGTPEYTREYGQYLGIGTVVVLGWTRRTYLFFIHFLLFLLRQHHISGTDILLSIKIFKKNA